MPSTRGGRRLCGLVVALGLCASGCFDNSSSKVVRDRADLDRVLATQHRAVNEFLSVADVIEITRAAAEALDEPMVIAVTDREGQVLAVFRKAGAPAMAPGNFGASVNTNDLAVSLARTGAFFSNDQAPLSSRTVRFISGIHFPPGISGKANAALYGIENTNRGCPLTSPEVPAFNPGAVPGLDQSVPQSRSLNGLPCDRLNQTGCGLGITTGKADVFDSNPGAADGWLIGPFPSIELTQAEITDIVSQAVGQALKTRAAIRLPMGISTRMVIAVSDLQGTIRGLFRMPDSTIFSIDVAVAKARN